MSTRTRSRSSRSSWARLAVPVLLVAAGLAGCGSDDDGATDATTTSTADGGTDPSTTADAATTTAAAEEPLVVVVTNDDGYDSEGIDAVVVALQGLDQVEVSVVAPLEQQSGQGGKYTEGSVESQEEQTASGTEVIAVNGFPADAVRVALDELDLMPDLVVSGINAGQNLGPVVDVSGTIGASRAAVDLGVPALALSSGSETFDYAAAVPFMLDWIEEHRAALVAGEAPVEVASINIPSCSTGEVRGLEEVPVGADGSQAIQPQDCASTLEDPPDDLTAFNNGFATLSVLPDDPATPYESG